MAPARRLRDSALIDALEATAPVPYAGPAWRVVRQDRDVLQCGAAGGRWDDGSFDVLYTSELAEGAVAEMDFHLSRGQPVIPSRVVYELHELSVAMERALEFADLSALAALGVETARYGSLSTTEKAGEYPRSQEVAEAAHFVGFDGLIVPSARFECRNLIIFCDRVAPAVLQATHNHGAVDWKDWRRRRS